MSGIVVAITGGIGCGKSEVLKIIDGFQGWNTLDADDIAHQLLLNPKFVREHIIPKFGPGVIGAMGVVDRAAIGQAAFANPELRKYLEEAMHPTIMNYIHKWRDQIRQTHGANGAVAIPLLFEIGAVDGWDSIICVCSHEKDMYDRLHKRGWDDAHIALRLSAQMPLSEKVEKSDKMIVNASTIEALSHVTIGVLNDILKEKIAIESEKEKKEETQPTEGSDVKKP